MALVSDYKYESAEIFSYFEQFIDYDVDLTQYLINFSTTAYPLKFSNMQPTITKIKDIFTKIMVSVDYKKYASAFETYVIEDAEDPFIVSYKKYGKIDYWWVIFLLNDIHDPLLDWPLTHEELNNLAVTLYTKEGKYTQDTYYNILFEQNEKKRIIRLPSIDSIVDMFIQYRQIKQQMGPVK